MVPFILSPLFKSFQKGPIALFVLTDKDEKITINSIKKGKKVCIQLSLK